jgi:hypothetical protein
MSSAPSLGIPELAGLGSYAAAARVGYSVDENVRRLLRYQWTARRIMATLVAHLPATPTWEVKCAMALHQWQLAEQVEAIRQRIGEMRRPVPALDAPPDDALHRTWEELLRSRGEGELLAGVYGVALPALVEAYREHLATTNLLVDHPTRRLLRFGLLELDEAVEWGARAVAALEAREPGLRGAAALWRGHLASYLGAAGGVAGGGSPESGAAATPVELPPARSAEPFVPDLHPSRDRRFRGSYNFVFPPHEVYNHGDVPADERNLALLAKRTLEMDVPELMASVMVERTDLPWEFQRDYSRQLWDEARHAMMGSVAFEARGVDWTAIPLNVGFSLRLNLHATPLERQVILFGIEQSLMPGATGKRFEYETAVAAGDPLSTHFHDYDWADEVLHAQIGRRWLKQAGIGPDEAMEQAARIHERTWAELDRYRDREPQVDWWDDFVRRVLGKPAAPRIAVAGAPKILAE